ncbi:MAG: hypothetical protein U0M15_03270 [Bacillota bacterium]|nr:hypothetical protein [Bacillota bacterium]
MRSQHKFCVFSAFLIGSALGYLYRDYVGSGSLGRKHKGAVLIFPDHMGKKAKCFMKNLKHTWEDLM